MTQRPTLHPGFLVLGVVALFAAYRVGFAREQIGTGLALAIPLGLAGWAFVRANELGEPARRFAIVTLFAVAAASELATWRAVVPPAPLLEAQLSTTKPDAEIKLPNDASNFFVELAAPGAEGDSEGKVSIVLARDKSEQTLAAEFHSQAVRTRRGSGQSVHDSERFHVNLPGAGPVHAHLDSASGGMGKAIHLALFDDPLWARALLAVMGVGVAVSLWLGGSRLVGFAGFAPALGMLAAYGWYLPMHLGKSDRTSSLFGIVIVAVALGGLGTLVVQELLRRVWPGAQGEAA